MDIYTAAVYSNGYCFGQPRWEKLNDRERWAVWELPNILESWHYVGKQKYVDEMRNNRAQIFLDSGAFSAHTLGVSLDVKEYSDYIIRNRDILRNVDGDVMASVLDGIGDPLKTYENQMKMEYYGADPLPCYHYGEDERYLEYYVANYDYITIGGMVGKSQPQATVWLDRVWEKYMVDGAGKPKVKVHGFGITAIPIMERYPWYSCDSSSWIQSAAFGTIVDPKHGALSVSGKSPSRHDKGRHISTLTQIEQDYILQKLEANGFTYERLSTIYESRAAYNLWSFGVINTLINAAGNDRFKIRVQELFG